MSDSIKITKPIAFYKKKVKVGNDFFKNLGKAVISYKTGNITVLLKDLLNVLSSFKLITTANEKGYVFIINSLTRTCFRIIGDHQELFSDVSLVKKIGLEIDFDEKLDELEISINKTLFTHPDQQEFLKDFILIFKEWLMAVGIKTNYIENMTYNFNRTFVIEMIEEWSDQKDYYADISTALENNPFATFSENRKKKESYLRYLVDFYKSVIFGDETGMTLADVYVTPDFSIFRECFTKEEQLRNSSNHDTFWEYRAYQDIHQYIKNFLEENVYHNDDLEHPHTNCLMILGYPGQGKTSMCYKTLYELIEVKKKLNTNYYLIKLRNISESKELINTPIKVIKSVLLEIFQQDFDRNEKNVVLLDGLDELYMKEGLNSNDIDEFCRELGNQAFALPDTKFIITSRYGYVNLERLKKSEFTIISLDEFDTERQKSWIENYTKFHPESHLTLGNLEYINKNTKHVAELIRQPILLHLVSQVAIDYDKLSNRTDIYNKLFDSIIERKWEKSGQIDNLRGLQPKHLRNYIRDIALAIFQGDYEYIRKKELEDLPATTSFLNKLENKNLQGSLKSIMISFYFQEIKKDKSDVSEEDNSNYAIEFLHKSLQEYLVAEKIWYGFLALIETKRDGDYFIDTWQEALQHLTSILSTKRISTEVVNYLKELIENEADVSVKEELKNRLALFLDHFLEVNFYHQHRTSYKIENSLNTFYGFWTIFSHLDIRENHISEKHKETFVKLLKWTCSQADLYLKLTFQDLSKSDLKGVNFNNCNLNNMDLSNCELQGSSFFNAVIHETNLESSKMDRVDFKNTVIFDSNFIRTSLTNCNLNNVKFYKVDFTKSDFLKCFYLNASFKECDFTSINNLSTSDLFICKEMVLPKGLKQDVKNALGEEKMRPSKY